MIERNIFLAQNIDESFDKDGGFSRPWTGSQGNVAVQRLRGILLLLIETRLG